MKVIYIAGPFRATSRGRREQNTYRARQVAFEIWMAGMAAICPHTNSGDFSGRTCEQSVMDGYLEIVRRCDALLLLPGWKKSEGSLRERQTAIDAGIPVYESLQELKEEISK